jgi:hypothetical protein
VAVLPSLRPALAAFAIALLTIDPATAALNRCNDPDGRVTFTEQPCEAGQEQIELKSRSAKTPPEKPAQQETLMQQAPQHESAECMARRESLAKSREQLESVVGLKNYELVISRVRNHEQYLQKNCR